MMEKVDYDDYRWWKNDGNMMINHSFMHMMNNDGKQWALVTIDDEQ